MVSFFGEKDNAEKEQNQDWEDWEAQDDVEDYKENYDKEEKKMNGTGKLYQVLNFK